MSNCIPVGWVDAPWGMGSWGGVLPFPGGPLPFTSEFNIYCVGACGEMAIFLDYGPVEEYSGPNQITVDPSLSDLLLRSGGIYATDTARIFVDANVGPAWSMECTFRINDMPSDFGNLPERHIFIGSADRQGGCAGLFFSAVGIAYTGSAHYDGNNDLVVNGALQILPGSINMVQKDIFYTIRLVCDFNTGTTYVYVTPTADVPAIGHQLKFILPTIASASQAVPPQDGTYISVRGTTLEPSTLQLNTLCLGNGVVIPNLPPIADAGADQAARTCSIVRLDGRRSFDPEGANLLYKWRLVDGPITSAFVLVADDGHTVGSIQTNKLYSDEAQVFDADPGIAAGDVLLIDGEPYTIVDTGFDTGFFIRIEGHLLEGGLSNRPFRILKQNTISGATTAQPTFYPDVPGLYKFDLVVFDGGLFSAPSNTIVNVTESPVPRGCAVDVRFLWNYISDFWRLVEDTDVIETFWGALAQVAASELLTLWQHEYSKSLRDIQRTFQRRWLHYDLFIQEPQIEQTTIRTIFAGVQSRGLDGSEDIAGKTIVVVLPDGSAHELFLTQPDPSPRPGETIAALQRMLQRRLQELDRRFTVDVQWRSDGNEARFVVRAPFPFVFTADSTATALFNFPARNDLPRGSGGAAVGINGYKVGRSLAGIDVQTGDYLVVGGVAYRILRVVSDPGDDWEAQRLILSDNIPLNLGSDWVIAGATRSTFLDFYNSLCSAGDTAIYEVVQKSTGQLSYFACDTLSAAADGTTALLTEHYPIAAYLVDDDYDVYFHSIYRRTYMPVDELVVEIPTLQEKIRNTDDTQVLRQNIDFFRTEYRGLPCIKFVTGSEDVWQGGLPPRRMWAETTYIDNRPVIEQNFGIPAEFTLDDLSALDKNIDYLSSVRGLWYAYFSGPTLYNLRVGTQILLGLPFAEEAGTIIEVDTDFSANQGRFLIQDLNEQAIVRSYTYPRVLPIEINPATGERYKVGDTVTQFSPLVEGVEIVDYLKDPKWFEGLLNQGSFYEVEKFFKFLVRVDSAAFNLNTLLFAIQFVKRIKPTYTFPVLMVRQDIGGAGGSTTVDVSDDVRYHGVLTLQASIVPQGQALCYDQTHPSGGGWWSQFDSGPNGPYTPPTYPNAIPMSNWIHDQGLLAPNETALAVLTRVLAAPELPTADSIYYADLPIYSNIVAIFESGMRFWLPQSGYRIGRDVTCTTAATINKIVFFLRFIAPNATPLILSIFRNNALIHTEFFVTPYFTGDGIEALKIHKQFSISPGLAAAPGDVFRAELAHQNNDFNTFIETCGVVIGEGEDWFADVPVAAGTWKSILPL